MNPILIKAGIAFVVLMVLYTVSLYYMKLSGTVKKGKDKEANWSTILLLSLVMTVFTFVMSALGVFILRRKE